jgi:hypothetical protein
MVVEKAFGRDSPLRQGAGKRLWTLLISRQWRWWLVVGFVENWSGVRFFSSRGIYRRKGGVRRWTRQSHPLVARPGPGPHHPRVWLAPGPPPSHLQTLSRFGKNRRFGFCSVQFWEYFLCSFFETQKQQKIGNWHCGVSLVGYFWKMHKSATKCNKTQSKWCINKHGASKIIDTFETSQASPSLTPARPQVGKW